jgi:hypothetical protein
MPFGQCHGTIHALWRGAHDAATTMQSKRWHLTSGHSSLVLISADIVRRQWRRTFRHLKDREALAHADLTPRFKTSTRKFRYYFADAFGFRGCDLTGRADDVRIQTERSTHQITPFSYIHNAHHDTMTSKHQMYHGTSGLHVVLHVLCTSEHR